MSAAPAILLLIAAQATATFGIRAENRTGQRPVVVGGEQELITEFEVVPSIVLDLRFKRTTLSLNYAPRAYSRLDLQGENTTDSARPLFLHGFGFTFNQIFTRRLQLSFTAAGSVGEVDYGNVDLAAQRTGASPTGGTGGTGGQMTPASPGLSATGGIPSDTATFSTQNYGATLGLAWEAVRNHSITLGVSGDYNSSLGANGAFPPSYGASGSLGWAWQLDPNYAFNLETSYGESFVEPATGGVGHFRSISASAGFDLRLSRLFNLSLAAGALLAENDPTTINTPIVVARTGWSVIPTGNIAFTYVPTSGQGAYNLSTTLSAGVEGFVDPLAQTQGVVPRVAFGWSMLLTFLEDWSFAPGASLFTPLQAPPSGMEQNSLNETLISASLPFEYRLTDEVGVAFGGRFTLRTGNLLADDPLANEQTNYFLLGFLAFTAGVATRL